MNIISKCNSVLKQINTVELSSIKDGKSTRHSVWCNSTAIETQHLKENPLECCEFFYFIVSI